MRLRVLVLVAFAACAFGQTPPHVRATLSLASGAMQYRQGELIEVRLQLTADQPEQFEAYERDSDRWMDEPRDEFHVTPATGAVDPLAAYLPFLRDARLYGAGSSFLDLPGALPVTITLPLTDWVRFDRPGHYKLFLRTSRVATRADGGTQGTPLTLDTNEVEFDIVPADADWQARQLAEIVSQTPINWPRLHALGTADAARFLAQQYRPDMQPLDQDVLRGLFGSPNRQAGTQEMERLLLDPDYAVSPSFLEALALLELPASKVNGTAIYAGIPQLREQLSRALASKRGPALVTSRQTYIAGLEQNGVVSFSPDVIAQVMETFEQLPTLDQGLWLGQRWTQVRDRRWLPLLRKLATRARVVQPGVNPAFDPVVEICGMALKRWYELEPVSGREAILHEITSDAPRFGADVLEILPDHTLPDEQRIIAEHFASLKVASAIHVMEVHGRARLTAQANLAALDTVYAHLGSLLFRYANGDVLNVVLPELKSRFLQRGCDRGCGSLAYLLKVDQAEASALVRAGTSDLYEQIGKLIASPVIERLAIDSLDEDDLTVAAAALRYLRDYGSARSEEPIFQRLVRWNAKWRDRASQLTSLKEPGLMEERSFGMELAQTLARGRGWFAGAVRIRQLLSLTLENGEDGDLRAALDQLEAKPAYIHFMGNAGPMFLIAQYQLDSVESLKNKLSQFPAGTVFVWGERRSTAYETLDRSVSSEMERWSAETGVRILGL